MSQIRVDEIRNGAGSETDAPAIPALEPRLAQAWINFTQQGVTAIRRSFNVSSVIDGGVGDTTVNYITPMGTSDYAAIGTAWSGRTLSINTQSTTNVRIIAGTTVNADSFIVNLAIFSDL